MRREVKILLVEDDDGHAALIRKNLQRSSITNPIVEFRDGREVLDFLFENNTGSKPEDRRAFLLLLDLHLPGIGGEEVLRRLKADAELKKISIIIITNNNDPKEVEKCHQLGCSNYIAKPVIYENFVDAIKKLGLFLMIVEVPSIKPTEAAGEINSV